MSEPTVEALGRRLDHLERENRRLKRAGTVGLIGLAAVLLMGQALPSRPAKVVESEKFVVRDARGNILAELGPLGDTPLVGLAIFDKDKKARVQLRVLPDGSSQLAILDKNSQQRVSLQVDSMGTPGFGLTDTDGTLRAMFTVEGSPYLSLLEKGGKIRTAMLTLTQDGPLLGFSDKNGALRALFTLGKDGTPEIKFNDKDRKVIWKAP